ncbi:MAG: hypothetical protein ACTSPQ_11975, partial [Candidatus Helarchaeota archaeon]
KYHPPLHFEKPQVASGSVLLSSFLVGGLKYDSIGTESTASLLKFRTPDERSSLINYKFICYKVSISRS